MSKNINNNGYDYVDLGLPSGTFWSTCNVGALKPSDPGLYFQWGDTVGYKEDQIGYCGEKMLFNWNDYKFNPSGDGKTFTKYKNPSDRLELENDIACVHMGGDWHIPSPEQILELINDTTSTWTTQNGVNGRLFTSKKNPSKSIFIPAVGYAWGGSVNNSGVYGNIWSSMLSDNSVSYGKELNFNSSNVYLINNDRYIGFSVRGVLDNNSKEKKNNMNENLDLTKTLKDAPRGIKLWSPVYGDCTFINIDYLPDVLYPVHCQATTIDGESTCVGFTKDGCIDVRYVNSGCVLFPSKENHDWSTFEIPKTHKEFELNQKVLVGSAFNHEYIWKRDIYLNYDENTKMHCTFYEKAVSDSLIIPYDPDKDGKKVPFEYYIGSGLDNEK